MLHIIALIFSVISLFRTNPADSYVIFTSLARGVVTVRAPDTWAEALAEEGAWSTGYSANQFLNKVVLKALSWLPFFTGAVHYHPAVTVATVLLSVFSSPSIYGWSISSVMGSYLPAEVSGPLSHLSGSVAASQAGISVSPTDTLASLGSAYKALPKDTTDGIWQTSNFFTGQVLVKNGWLIAYASPGPIYYASTFAEGAGNALMTFANVLTVGGASILQASYKHYNGESFYAWTSGSYWFLTEAEGSAVSAAAEAAASTGWSWGVWGLVLVGVGVVVGGAYYLLAGNPATSSDE